MIWNQARVYLASSQVKAPKFSAVPPLLTATFQRQRIRWGLVRSLVGIPIRLIDADGNYLTDAAGNILTA